jgi:divalent metal cation (Fe/Co/Zn/Cd) transporter
MTRDWTRIAFWLVLVTLAYNIVEAGVALSFGVVDDSIALFGFGLDSVIECAAATAMLWHLSQERRGVSAQVLEQNEHRVHRFVGWTFIALALYVSFESVISLWRHEIPQVSVVGIILAAASLTIMPIVAMAKLRAAREIGSAALRAEAKETLACSYLSFILLLGLGANAVFAWWWMDPVAALAMVPWLLKEGREGIRGDGCCD